MAKPFPFGGNAADKKKSKGAESFGKKAPGKAAAKPPFPMKKMNKGGRVKGCR